jgi:hypothetical protein
MTTLIGDRARGAVASPARYFYFNMALACMATAVLGFAPTYWLPPEITLKQEARAR